VDYRFNVFPASAGLRILLERLNAEIEFLLLSVCQFEAAVVFGYAVPDLFNKRDSLVHREFLGFFNQL